MEKIALEDLLMDKAPIFCENLKFRKLIWEELHTEEPIKRERMKSTRLKSIVAQHD